MTPLVCGAPPRQSGLCNTCQPATVFKVLETRRSKLNLQTGTLPCRPVLDNADLLSTFFGWPELHIFIGAHYAENVT